MRTPLALLKCVAKALGNAFGGGIAGDLLVEVLPEVSKDVWKWWGMDRSAEQRRAEVQAVAQAGAEEIRLQASDIVLEMISDKPPEVRQAVEAYLTQVPAAVRRSLRRPSDPTGTTVPPDLAPENADDLLRLLPGKPSRFKAGDHPAFKPDWVLEQLLGVGGFGEVWKARNPHLSYRPPVALKYCLDPAAAKVLRNEAAVLGRVMREGKHPGIVQLQDTFLSAETPCLEYEYVEGGELTELIQEWRRRKGGPTPQETASVILELAKIVGHAHQLTPPIVHRDLKPANILLERTAEGKARFKIADFGIGGVAAAQAIRETSRGAGRGGFLASALHGAYTPLYASPQQMRGEPPDPRDDVYSLGVIWYQLLTGDLSAGRPGGSRWRKKLTEQGMPSGMTDVLESCFEEHPDDRPANAAALAQQVSETLAFLSPPPLLPPVSPPTPAAAGEVGSTQGTTSEVGPSADPRDRPASRSPLKEIFSEPFVDEKLGIYADFGFPEGGAEPAPEPQPFANPDHDKQLRGQDERRGEILSHGKVGDVITNSLGMQFAWVPPGESFLAGGGTRGRPGAKKFTHIYGTNRFTLPQGLWCGVYPVTQAEWQAVMGDNPSHFNGNPRHPVECVSWNRVQQFIEQLNQRTREEGLLYRLPTEREWEYICRGGSLSEEQSKYHFYFARSKSDLTPAPSNDLSSTQANFDGNYPAGSAAKGPYLGRPSDVGLYMPNPLGIYDLHGNVWEWTSADSEDKGGSARVVRGGCWNRRGAECTASSMRRLVPTYGGDYIGFRLVAT